MSCKRCGGPCQGSMCKECEIVVDQEGRLTPAEYMELQEDEDDGD